jgi:hypothetical protein
MAVLAFSQKSFRYAWLFNVSTKVFVASCRNAATQTSLSGVLVAQYCNCCLQAIACRLYENNGLMLWSVAEGDCKSSI